MGKIYLEVGKPDVSKAPKEVADIVKSTLQDAVKDSVKGNSDFTDKKGEGYVVTLKVADMTVEAGSVSCTLSGDIARTPRREMVTTSMKASASAQGGKPEALAKQCVEAAAESMMDKAVPVMKKLAR